MSSTRQLGSSTSHTTSQLRVTAVRDIEKIFRRRKKREESIYEYDVFNGHMPKERERKEKIFLCSVACFISCLELFNWVLLCVHTNKYVRDFEMVNDDYSNWYFIPTSHFSLLLIRNMSVWRKGSSCEIHIFIFNNGHHRAAFISGFLQ